MDPLLDLEAVVVLVVAVAFSAEVQAAARQDRAYPQLDPQSCIINNRDLCISSLLLSNQDLVVAVSAAC